MTLHLLVTFAEALPVILLTLIISIALALLLWGASVILHVDEDPRLQDVMDLLPNQNCGLCGNPGCKGMAEAILAGEVRLSQCKPGDQAMREEIRDYLAEHPDENGEYVKVKM
jgi:electron transport complex protein RnfB